MPTPEVVYSVVAARRLQWDNLVWQVPVLSLTAQAFLFTIAVGADSSNSARIISSLLSLLVTFLCITLMARHRQAEIYDAHWLEDVEKREWKMDVPVHGHTFAKARDQEGVDGGWIDKLTPRPRQSKNRKAFPGYRTWIGGLLLFGLAALFVLATTLMEIAIGCPHLFD
ncbi:hypothetical protein [Mycobacterium sp. ITM-2016-00318]|uniref:hypothetical protein n=1 Tax=Mycobacterium sp. ITM-2016-00318 TaxID=2099693 RepID=UPI000CF930B4|nr:hypothetical protein [Mycobacterium sp. ITM-2016-00318]WNG95285.1 hypothetical protein C6A82_013135 [Mycobacterium sp. ITM-2016-00318]